MKRMGKGRCSATSGMVLGLTLLVAILAGCAGVAPTPVAPPQASVGPTGIAGTVVDQHGQAAAGGFVYAYRSPRGGMRGPADFEAVVGADGRYFLDVVEGSYHLVARMRQGGADAGPPRAGDAWSIFAANPLVVSAGQTSRADFRLQGVAQPMLLKQGSLTAGDTGFTGRVVDRAGQPVAGAFALAYATADFRRMPDHTSPAVGEDGHFALFVPQGGRFCLAVRTKTRGQPMAGELYGVLGEGAAGCREITSGVILDVGDITVTPYSK